MGVGDGSARRSVFRGLHAGRPGGPRRGRAAAWAMAGIGLASCVGVGSPGPSSAPIASLRETPVATAPREPTPVPSTTAPGQLRWTSVPLDIPGGGTITGIAVRPGTPPLYVALTDQGAVLRSSDARTWTRSADLAQPDGRPAFGGGLTYGAGRFEAAGAETQAASTGFTFADYHPTGGIAWTSTDAVTWTVSRLSRTGTATFLGSLVGDLGAIAGTVTGEEGGNGAIASTADGRTWRYAALPDSRDVTPQALAHLAAGRWVAAGFEFAAGTDACPPPNAIAWTSDDDGVHWQAASAGLTCGIAFGLLPTPAGILLFGRDATDPAAPIIWSSTDGTAWAPFTTPFTDLAWPMGTAPDGTLLVASGNQVFESTDGLAWAPSLTLPHRDDPRPAMLAGHLVVRCDPDLGCEAYLIDG